MLLAGILLLALLALASAAALAAVTISSFTAQGRPASIHLTWKTGSEVNNIGFNLLRSTSDSGPFDQINPEIISSCFCVGGVTYTFDDADVSAGQTFYYKLQSVNTSGGTEEYGPVSAALVAATATPTQTNTPRPTATRTTAPVRTATPTSTLPPVTATPTQTTVPTTAAPTLASTLEAPAGPTSDGANGDATGVDVNASAAEPTKFAQAAAPGDENVTPSPEVTELALNLEATPDATVETDAAAQQQAPSAETPLDARSEMGARFLFAVLGSMMLAGSIVAMLAGFLIWYVRRA